MKIPCATCDIEKVANKTKSSEFSWRNDRKRYYGDCKACRNVKGSKTITMQTKEREAIESNPHGFLAAGIIEKAIKDYREDDSMRGEVLAFFLSAWFGELCDMAGCDPEYLRKCIGV